jgi:hypothetical protein
MSFSGLPLSNFTLVVSSTNLHSWVCAGPAYMKIRKLETSAIGIIFIPLPYLVFQYQKPLFSRCQPAINETFYQNQFFLILSDPVQSTKELYSKDRYLLTSENSDDRFDKIDICRAYRAMDLPFNKSAGFRLTLYEHLAVILELATFT